MKQSIHSILMGAMLMALPMMLTSCDLLFGEEDNPTVMTAFEEGALVEFTYPYNGTLHTSTFKKVGSNYVLQSAPLDAGELKAIEELVALNGNELLQFTVYLADSSDTEEEVDDSEFEIDDDDEDDGDDDENASRAFTRAISEETLNPVGIRIQLKTSTQSITTISNHKAFGLGDGGAEETVTATISGKGSSGYNRTRKITVNNSKDKKYISVYYEGKKHTITFSENDTWTDVLNEYQESGLGDYLFVKDGKMMFLLENGSGKKTKYYECWLKNDDSYVSPSDAVSSSKSYSLEKNMTKLKFFKDDYTVEDGEILTGTLKKKYHLIIPDGYTVTLFNATIKHGSKNRTTPAIECLGNATIIIADGTKNSVKTVVNNVYQTAITVPDKNLIIKGQINGTGKLSISGYAGVSAPSLSIEGGNTFICAKETGYNGEAGDGINVSGGTLDVKSKTANGIFGKLLVTGGKVTVGTSGKVSGVAAISGECSISGGTITAKAAKVVAIIGDVSASGGTLSATSKKTKAISGVIFLGTGMKLYEGDIINHTTVAENQMACTKSCAVIKPASE